MMPSIREDIYSLLLDKQRIWEKAIREIERIDNKIILKLNGLE